MVWYLLAREVHEFHLPKLKWRCDDILAITVAADMLSSTIFSVLGVDWNTCIIKLNNVCKDRVGLLKHTRLFDHGLRVIDILQKGVSDRPIGDPKTECSKRTRKFVT